MRPAPCSWPAYRRSTRPPSAASGPLPMWTTPSPPVDAGPSGSGRYGGATPRRSGVVAGLGTAYPDGRVAVLDYFSMPDDPEAAAALVAHATDEAGAQDAAIFAPTGATVDDASLRSLVTPLRTAGWRLLVERRHYEFEPPADLGADCPTSLTFERLSDPDPRLEACHRGVMRDTLDAHDEALVRRVGFDQACRESLAYLLDADRSTASTSRRTCPGPSSAWSPGSCCRSAARTCSSSAYPLTPAGTDMAASYWPGRPESCWTTRPPC